MFDSSAIVNHIVSWLTAYCDRASMKGFIIGISGGVDSALTSTLCALTGKDCIVVTMPIRQNNVEYTRAVNHIFELKKRFSNVESIEIDLTPAFNLLESSYPDYTVIDALSMANTRARLRMTTLYALAQPKGLLVAGTGNKIEDFGVGFFTKYGDGGVDLSPIADLTKTQVRTLAKHVNVISEICNAAPTDGLWADGRTDEDQLGASYAELEWAMDFRGDADKLNERQREVIAIYRMFNSRNRHKMVPIPVCEIPKSYIG
jgi:NAD+ synthase